MKRFLSLQRLRSARYFGTVTCHDLTWNTKGVNDHGFPWPPDCTADSLEVARNFKCNPNDVYVVTYPKSGTTWTLHIIYQLATSGNLDYSAFQKVCPFWEAVPGVFAPLDKVPSPRVIKTHSPLTLLPDFREGRGKFVYVARDVHDVVVSFYNHSQLSGGELQMAESSFDKFFDMFMKGQVYYGSWFDHVDDALRARDESGRNNLLFITYEDLIRDLPNTVNKIMKFTGFNVEEPRLAELMDRFSFEWMKKNKDKLDFTQEYPGRHAGRDFFRNGVSGKGQVIMNPEQKAFLKMKFDAVLRGRLPYIVH